MANPQIEDGHVDLANEIVEALAKIRISGEEMQCLWVILRKTYGWHKKEDDIALSQFVALTGLSKVHVCRAINGLLPKKVITVTKKGNGITSYGFNKDYDTWQPLPKKVTLPKMVKGGTKKGKESLPKKVHTKETSTKETITKEIYGEFQNVKLTKEENQKGITQFGETRWKEMIENLSTYLASKGDKYKSHYATMKNWEKKNPKQIHKPETEYPNYRAPEWMKEGINKL